MVAEPETEGEAVDVAMIVVEPGLTAVTVATGPLADTVATLGRELLHDTVETAVPVTATLARSSVLWPMRTLADNGAIDTLVTLPH